MRYTFIKAEDLTSAAFRGAEPVDRATWLCLLAWCYEHENGGRIVGARQWGDRRWQQTVAVTLAEAQRETEGLWEWDGDDLIVPLYDAAYVEQVRADSRQGTAGGRATSEAKAEAARANARKRWHKDDANTDANEMPTPMPTPMPTQKVVGSANDANDAKPVCLSVSQSVSDVMTRAPETATSRPPDPIPDNLPTCPPAREARRYTVGDLTASHGVLLCHRPEDRDQAATLLALYGWDAVSAQIHALEPVAKARPPGRQRILLSELTAALERAYQLDPEDYQRAGLPVPAHLAKEAPRATP